MIKILISNKLQNIDWSNILHCNKAQESFSLFYKEFTHNFEECFPITKVKINYRNRKPWLTAGLRKLIKIKNKLYLNSIKQPCVNKCKVYKEYTNKLHYLIRKTERDHYLLTKNKHNISKS